MTKMSSDFRSPERGRRTSNVKTASAASIGATVLLVTAYLIASWLGIPLDGLTPSSGTPSGPVDAERPAAVVPAESAQVESPRTAQAQDAAPTKVAPANDVPQDTVQAASPFRIENVTVRNLDGKVAYRGTVDLTATMRRIDAGQRLEFRNDGSTFQNRERRLPSQDRGYYKEYVHPTPRLSGPGPQRIVTGESGEAYYTFDHYKTFQRIR